MVNLKRRIVNRGGVARASRPWTHAQDARATSHSLRYLYSQRRQSCGQLPARVIGNGNKYSAFYLVLFSDDSMTVIEKIEGLREIEGVLGKHRRLSAAGCLDIRIGKTRRQHQERPDLVARIALKDLVYQVATAPGTDLIARVTALRLQLSKDRICSHRRILAVWPRLSLKRQRLFEIKRNDRVTREL